MKLPQDDPKTLKNAVRKLLFDFKIREIEITKNMPVKIWLAWKRQVMSVSDML